MRFRERLLWWLFAAVIMGPIPLWVALGAYWADGRAIDLVKICDNGVLLFFAQALVAMSTYTVLTKIGARAMVAVGFIFMSGIGFLSYATCSRSIFAGFWRVVPAYTSRTLSVEITLAALALVFSFIADWMLHRSWQGRGG